MKWRIVTEIGRFWTKDDLKLSLWFDLFWLLSLFFFFHRSEFFPPHTQTTKLNKYVVDTHAHTHTHKAPRSYNKQGLHEVILVIAHL